MVGLLARSGNIAAVHAVAIAFWHLWIDVFGTSAVLLRLPSALAVALAVASMFVIGEQLAGRRVGVWAAVVLMVLPRVTSAGLEARSYAMTIAVSMWLTIAVLAARRHGGWQLCALGDDRHIPARLPRIVAGRPRCGAAARRRVA